MIIQYILDHRTYNNHFEIIKILLQDDRVDPSTQGDDNVGSPIAEAAGYGCLKIVQLLLRDHRVWNKNKNKIIDDLQIFI